MYKRIAGDSKTVTAFYGERTAIICAPYLLPFIKNTSNILDVGCGPGRITADFSQIAKGGKTIGLDNSPGILEEASSSFPISDFPNLSFAVGDALELDFPDNTFDIVHSHQVILHLASPVEALKEFRRVCKPGGIVATCDCSMANVLVWKPELPALRRYWVQTVPGLQRWGMNVKAGEQLEGYAREAGFATMKYQKGELPIPGHGGRMVGEAAEQNIKMGVGTMDDIKEWRKAWEEWESAEDKEWVIETGQLLCWKDI